MFEIISFQQHEIEKNKKRNLEAFVMLVSFLYLKILST